MVVVTAFPWGHPWFFVRFSTQAHFTVKVRKCPGTETFVPKQFSQHKSTINDETVNLETDENKYLNY